MKSVAGASEFGVASPSWKSGSEHDRHGRLIDGHPSRQTDAVHVAWHDDVAQHDGDAARRQPRAGLSGGSRFLRDVAERLYALQRHFADPVVVLDDENNFAIPARRVVGACSKVRFSSRLGSPRQAQRDHRAHAGLALDCHETAGLFDEVVDRAQSEAGAVPFCLGGEERVEGAPNNVFRHTLSIVGHGKADEVARPRSWTGTRGHPLGPLIARFDPDFTSARHGVPRIQDEVEHRAVDFRWIGDGEP